VRAFDARTGKQVWRFNTVPGAGEFGNETWGNESWKTQGHTNVWAPMSLDEARGLLYLPVSTPSNDFYGGDRAGRETCSASRSCVSTQPRGSGDGTSRSFTTDCGTTTRRPRRRWCR
jgi:quinoprotein glucose dehydrogenase